MEPGQVAPNRTLEALRDSNCSTTHLKARMVSHCLPMDTSVHMFERCGARDMPSEKSAVHEKASPIVPRSEVAKLGRLASKARLHATPNSTAITTKLEATRLPATSRMLRHEALPVSSSAVPTSMSTKHTGLMSAFWNVAKTAWKPAQAPSSASRQTCWERREGVSCSHRMCGPLTDDIERKIRFQCTDQRQPKRKVVAARGEQPAERPSLVAAACEEAAPQATADQHHNNFAHRRCCDKAAKTHPKWVVWDESEVRRAWHGVKVYLMSV
jgi:hypothetical protein